MRSAKSNKTIAASGSFDFDKVAIEIKSLPLRTIAKEAGDVLQGVRSESLDYLNAMLRLKALKIILQSVALDRLGEKYKQM